MRYHVATVPVEYAQSLADYLTQQTGSAATCEPCRSRFDVYIEGRSMTARDLDTAVAMAHAFVAGWDVGARKMLKG